MPSRIFVDDLLDGQVIVVTGGDTDLGRATTVELAACGARVAVTGRDGAALEDTVGACDAGLCEALPCDTRDEEQVGALVGRVLDRHGRIDTLVNGLGAEPEEPGADDAPDGLRSAVRLDLEGTWLATHAVATGAMIPAGSGKVVSLSPVPARGTPQSAATRAAVENMTRTLSVEWARFGIRLVAITGRFGAGERDPREPAWLVAYLASPAGDYHSGSVMAVGGLP